jgi:mono/diheme cytochrome c family protein
MRSAIVRGFARFLLLALGLVAIAASNGAWSQNAGEAKAGDAANGRKVFVAVGCFTCHGRSGQGGAFNYPAPALAQTRLPVEAFKAIVRAGPNDMPAYSTAVLADKDLADIHAFLMSLPGRRPAKDLPLLNQ